MALTETADQIWRDFNTDGVSSSGKYSPRKSEIRTWGNEIEALIVPIGGIILWSGAISAIPSRFALCDGTNGTPDLTGRFVVGAEADSGATYDVGDTGGASTVTLTSSQIPPHTHSFSATTGSAGSHNHSMNSGGSHSHTGTTTTNGSHTHADRGQGALWTSHDNPAKANVGFTNENSYFPSSPNTIPSGGSHNHTFTTSTHGGHTHTINSNGSHTHSVSGTTGSAGSGNSHENRPPYYALAYIMRTT